MAGSSEDSFIQPLGFLLGLTAILALILSYLGQSTIVAFITVGVIVNAVGVEPDPTTLGNFAEVGILILLFMAGLEVDLAAFAKNWKTAAIVGVGQIAGCTGLFAALSLAVLPAVGQDVNTNAVVYFGLCGCFSSTILVLGYLKSTKSMGTLHGQLCLGTLVLQDAASVLGIAVLGGLGEEGSNPAVSVLILFAKLFAAVVIILLLERFVLTWLFEQFARSLELLYLGALGYATGLAALAVTAGFSGEITAFLAGVSLSRLPYKMHIETKMEPIKSLGVAIFFISLGLGLELGQEMLDALPIGVGLACFKLFITLPLFMVLGVMAKLKSHTVFMLGLLMNQISEFSLILCTLCVRAYVFDKVVLTVLTVAAVVSIIVSSVGHAYIDAIYNKVQRWSCLRCIDERRTKKLVKKLRKSAASGADGTAIENEAKEAALVAPIKLERKPSLLSGPASGDGISGEWAWEDQLTHRLTEHLEIDLEETQKELEVARESMAATADEKKSKKSSWSLYGRAGPDEKKSRKSVVKVSHTTDIMHGMIEGYVVVDGELQFCTLRAGRVLFWDAQNDVGNRPPTSVWDVSTLAILEVRGGDGPRAKEWEAPDGDIESVDLTIVADDDSVHPWEWTIILGHIHRHTHNDTFAVEDDTMKLAIHGLEDHSDHDAQDWRDALAVATSTLNPIALRLAHIRKELHSRRETEGVTSSERHVAKHGHRNEIICIGYNEFFPAVLSLADAVDKEVVVVEYDPMKLSAIEKLYNEEKRRMDFSKDNRKRSSHGSLASLARKRSGSSNDLASLAGKRSGSSSDLASMQGSPMRRGMGSSTSGSPLRRNRSRNASNNDLPSLHEAHSTEDANGARDLERIPEPPTRPRPTRLRTMSSPVIGGGGSHKGFWASQSASEDNGTAARREVRGVKGEYADIHDPECWDELGMDEAFMVVCTMKGARHAEKAILDWLRRKRAIFVAIAQTAKEAMQMYKAGAHYVIHRDALAMRSTREIFLETVANVGDCSQLVAAGLAHKKRLLKLEEEDHLRFQYETSL
ncbi:hypothetical protein ACHAXT_005981 [Thalassiosira profunda]